VTVDDDNDYNDDRWRLIVIASLP